MNYTRIPPFASKEERQVTEALVANTVPASQLRGMARRPLFMPKYGWPTETPTIQDVLAVGRSPIAPTWNPNYTGGVSEINASARNTGVGDW